MVEPMDWYERQQQLAELDESIARNRAELEERRERNRLAEVLTPKPPQPQPATQQRSVVDEAAVLCRLERAAAAATPAPAPASTDWHAFGEVIGEDIARAVGELRVELRAEIAVLRAEIKVASEVEQLRREVEALRAERRGLKVVG